MRVALHRIGNSRGVILPKSLLAQLGVASEVDMEITNDSVILRKPRRPREGWATDSQALAHAGEDGLLWPEFENDDDADLAW